MPNPVGGRSLSSHTRPMPAKFENAPKKRGETCAGVGVRNLAHGLSPGGVGVDRRRDRAVEVARGRTSPSKRAGHQGNVTCRTTVRAWASAQCVNCGPPRTSPTGPAPRTTQWKSFMASIVWPRQSETKPCTTIRREKSRPRKGAVRRTGPRTRRSRRRRRQEPSRPRSTGQVKGDTTSRTDVPRTSASE